MNELREINNGVVFHTDQEVCIDDIKSFATEKIFLVTTERDATRILEEIHALTQVDSIFIFCFKPKKYQNLLQKVSKLIGIYRERQDLLNALKENIILVEKHLEEFSFYSQHKQKTTRDLSKESAEFLWFQMFKDVILRLPRDSHAKQQMIELCRHYYHGNEKELKFIQQTDSIIFADIAKFSEYPDEEVLFDFGTTFEIVSVKEDEKFNPCLIKLRASNKGSKVAKEHNELNRKDEEETRVELIFGKLLIDMGQYDQSLKYFQRLLLHNHTQKDDIAKINNLVESTYYNNDDLEKELEYYKLAYNLMMNDEPIRIKDSVRPLTNKGLTYHRKGQYDRTLELYSKSIEIFETYYGKNI
ncbi:unnamed protein product [Rotaria sp. Silwood2]|nr:unnamed protein product [Rotaria sp. Silwood2]